MIKKTSKRTFTEMITEADANNNKEETKMAGKRITKKVTRTIEPVVDEIDVTEEDVIEVTKPAKTITKKPKTINKKIEIDEEDDNEVEVNNTSENEEDEDNDIINNEEGDENSYDPEGEEDNEEFEGNNESEDSDEDSVKEEVVINKPKTTTKKTSEKEISNKEEDKTDKVDNKPKPKTKNTANKINRDKLNAYNRLMDNINEISKLPMAGPERGRRLYDEDFEDTKVVSTRKSSKEENLDRFVEALELNGLDYIFGKVSTGIGKRRIASQIYESFEEAFLRSSFLDNNGFVFLGGYINVEHVNAKLFKKFKDGPMKHDVIKMEHYKINTVNCNYNTSLGNSYKTNGSYDISIPVDDNEDGTVTIAEDNLFFKKGDVVTINDEGKVVKVTKKKTTK